MPEEKNPTTKGALSRLRTLAPLRPMTQHEWVHIVERQASELRHILDVQSDRFPVEDITELPRIELIQEPSLDVAGCAFWTGSNWTILTNASDAPTRQRFTALHELHHVVAHPMRRHLAKLDPAVAEPLADLFAANVLMPRSLVKRYWGEGPRSIDSLAQRFDVSHQAMAYRVRLLGLDEQRRRCTFTPLRDTEPRRFGVAA